MKKYTKVFGLFYVGVIVIGSLLRAHAEEEKNSTFQHGARSNIVGIVIDAQKHPVKNAKVTVLDPDNQEIMARGITNDKGEYVIECLDPHKYHLALSALPERFLGQTVVVNLGTDGQVVQWSTNMETPAVATARAGGGVCGCGPTWLSESADNNRGIAGRSNIVGTVRDAQGNPIKNVKVTVLDPDNQEIVAHRTTDDKGTYVIECLDHHKYTLALSTLSEQFLVQRAVVDLGKDGLDVQWAANMEAPDIDIARSGGVCSCAAAGLTDRGKAGALLVTGGVLGGGLSLGLLLSDDSGDSGDSRGPGGPQPASPSQ
jgi:carboxypeptidase family protein